MSEREFHLGDVLSVTAGILLSPRHMEGVYDILKYLTGDNLFTHQLPRAREAAGPWLLTRYPALVPVTGECEAAATAESWGSTCEAWLVEAATRYGSYFSLEPMPASAWLSVDPVKELAAMIGDERVIVVEAGDAP